MKSYPILFTCNKLGMAFALFLLLGGYSYAQTWNGSVSSDWDNPANWNGGNVPGSGANVTIPGNQPNNPVITSTITIQEITIGTYSGTALLTVENTGVITLTNAMSLSGGGQLHIDGGAVNITGSNFTQVYNANTFIEMTSGSFSTNGNMNLIGGNDTSNPAFSAGSGIVDIGGNLNVLNNKIFNAGTGTISVQGTIEINGTYNGDDGTTNFYGASTIGNGGVVNLDTGLITFHNNTTILGDGTINMGTGEVIFNNDIKVGSSGFVNVENGTMTVTGDAVFQGNGNLSTNTGSINIVGNANMQNGGEMNLNSGSLNVGGNATVNQGGIINAGSAHINLQGDFSVQENSNFNPETSTVTFSGDENQTINVNNHDDITFYNVVVEDGATLETDGANENTVIIENNLSVQSGGSVYVKDNNQINIQGQLDDEDENIVIKKPYVRHVTTPFLTEVVLEFDKDMVESTVENIGNYTIDNGITISNAEQDSSNLRFVTLTVSTFTADVEYEITINNLEATNGAEIKPNHIKRFGLDVHVNPCENEVTWTGTENTNWNNTANWSCNALPTLQTNVTIPDSLASNNYPIINSGVNAYAKNIIIESNASVEVNANWLRIAGDLTSNGILNTESGSISFQGISAQIIPNTAFKNNRVQNLRIDNISGVTSETTIEVTGTVKVESGNFNTGNELILISDENKTALIDGTGNGGIIGLVSMQRYLDKAFGYKYFSSPFQNLVVGDFAPYMDFQDPVTGFPNFYRYDEDRRALVDSLDIDLDATGWTVYTNPDNNLNIAEGYALNFGTSTDAQTIELIGEVNNGKMPARQLENNHRKYTKGFHLVGNPYPSPIDWNAAKGWTRTNIDDGIYFFTASDTNQYTGTYTAYVNKVSTEDKQSSNIIPSMQGFFIKVSDSNTQDLVTGSFGMDNNVRVNDFNQKFLRTQDVLKPLIRLEAGFSTSSRKDPMVIYFSSFATPNFEKEKDAHKLMNTDPAVPSFYNLTTNNKELAINAIPFPESRSYRKIPLGIKADQNGEMQIRLARIENLNSNFNIYLIDHEKGKGQNLRNNPEYTFSMQAGTHNSRFELLFSEEKVTSPAIAFNEPFHVEVSDGDVIVKLNLEENQQGILRASTMMGQILQVKPGGGKDEVIFDGITSDGVYIINLQLGKAQHAKKVIIKK